MSPASPAKPDANALTAAIVESNKLTELWGGPPYPPRTMVEVKRLFDDDIVEIDSVFYAPVKKK
jgi:hypothetical protein